jgi:hypothetical protein
VQRILPILHLPLPLPILQRIFRLLFLAKAELVAGRQSVLVCVFAIMASQIQEVFVKYMERVLQKLDTPRFSYWRGLHRDDGGPNRLFFAYLFNDYALAIGFLQDAKLIRSQVLCDTCGR